MPKINPCFKKTFVVFNVLFAVFGLVILAVAGLVHLFLEEFDEKWSVVLSLYVTGGVTFIIATLGAYGAHTENKGLLIAFFTLMCTGTVILFRVAVPVAILRSEMILTMKTEMNHLVPLDRTRPNVQYMLVMFQKTFQCCGFFNGYQDWGEEVPDSCDCVSTYVHPDECQQMTSVSAYKRIFQLSNKSRMVYKEPCGPVLMQYLNKIYSSILGVLFGLAALALLGTVMSLAMIIRVSATGHSPLPTFGVSYIPPKYSVLEKNIK
ncbi:hypothetical protein P4O66_014192 [Electrophorus voltai]|uniref:Tetraspanin n=1 Tax=Electrophorus voltai TaxID=2609070 RepID=A0AAD8Z2U5_9TELE|nr:hypothetical protein P4O66_014192 [Electrophorus voltai]